MPYVDIKVAGELSDDQKNAIAMDVAKSWKCMLVPLAVTHITFTEIPRHSWAKHGALLESSDGLISKARVV